MTEESKNKESKTTILQGVLRKIGVRKKKKKSLVWYECFAEQSR